MRNEGKFVSLKNRLTRFCICIFAVLLAFSVYVYATGQKLLTESQDMALLYKSAANYYMGLDYIDRSLYQYAHTPSQDLKSSIESYGEMLTDSAARLSGGLDDPVARDQLEIARSYMTALKVFLENAEGLPVAEMLRQYDEIHQMKTLITRLYKTFEMSIEAARAESERQIAYQNQWQQRLFVLLFLSLGALSILYTKRFSQKLLGPVLHLTEMTAAAWESPDYLAPRITLLPPGRQDETRILTQSFYLMLERLDRQMAELQGKALLEQQLRIEEAKHAKIQKKLDHAQLRMLQSQVNPHFLFNVMNSSAELAFIEGAEQTEHLLKQIAVYLRYALSNVDKVVTLEDEKHNIEAYIDIQRMRFGDRIDFSLNFEPQSLETSIPAIILQPMLENAIVHGVGVMCGGGKIEISASSENGWITVAISDNGQGLSEEKLAELKGRLAHGFEYGDGQGIGLMNVYNRLQLFFDGRASCAINSQPYVKTCFELSFPAGQTARME